MCLYLFNWNWKIENLGWQHVMVPQCLSGKMSWCQIAEVPKCRVAKMLWCQKYKRCQNVLLPKCRVAIMSCCQNVVLPKWLLPICRLPICRVPSCRWITLLAFLSLFQQNKMTKNMAPLQYYSLSTAGVTVSSCSSSLLFEFLHDFSSQISVFSCLHLLLVFGPR